MNRICKNCRRYRYQDGEHTCSLHPTGEQNPVTGKITYDSCWKYNQLGKCSDFKKDWSDFIAVFLGLLVCLSILLAFATFLATL